METKEELAMKRVMIEYDNKSPMFYYRWSIANKMDLSEDQRAFLNKMREEMDKHVDALQQDEE
jgi:hypothetical protein